MADQLVSPTPGRKWPRGCWLLVAGLLGLSLLRFPVESGNRDLDYSWGLCLAHFCKHSARAGIDYVWTYGPLGYFTLNTYDPDLFWYRYAWEVVFTGILAGLLAGLGAALPSRILQVVYVLVLVGLWAAVPDTVYAAAVVLAAVLPLRAERLRRGVVAAAGVFLAVIALTKFTFCLLAAAAWLLLVVGFWRDRGRRVETLLSFPLAFALLWCALGQRLADLPTFLAASWEVAAGYAEAMAADGRPSRQYMALGVFALLAVLARTLWRTPLGRGRRLAALGVVVLAVLLQWRHGFTRQASHDHHFFNFVRFAPFTILALAGPAAPRWETLLGTIAVVALGWVGWLEEDAWKRPGRILANARMLLFPAQLRQDCQQGRDAAVADLSLPNLAARVGDESVDLLSCDQAWLLLNGLRYQPRPVFQSYSAYTPRLLEDNAAFFRGPQAPRFVLCLLHAIDGRFPASEDGPALLGLLHQYQCVAQEKGILLLERRLREAEIARRVVWQGEVTFGEEVPLPKATPGVLRVVTMHIEDTARGWLERRLGRPPPLFLRVRCGEDHERYRLVPALAGAGFLLDPLVRDTADLGRLWRGAALPIVAAFAVEASPKAQACYRPRLRIVIEEESIPAAP